jgi:hypothetical protein
MVVAADVTAIAATGELELGPFFSFAFVAVSVLVLLLLSCCFAVLSFLDWSQTQRSLLFAFVSLCCCFAVLTFRERSGRRDRTRDGGEDPYAAYAGYGAGAAAPAAGYYGVPMAGGYGPPQGYYDPYQAAAPAAYQAAAPAAGAGVRGAPAAAYGAA